MFCYSDNVDKELKYNLYKSVSSIDSHAFHPKEECSSEKKASKVWRIFKGDTLETILIAPLHCKYNQTKGDAHKSSLEWWKYH